MKKLLFSALLAGGLVAGIEAAPTDAVTQADLKALVERITKLEAENKLQAQRIAELESAKATCPVATCAAPKGVECEVSESNGVKVEKGTTVSDSGRIYETASGKKYYLADACSRIFEPLSESGLQITPYGYLVFEGVYSSRPLNCDWSADFVSPRGEANNTTLSMQDSIMGVQFDTPEATRGWKFTGRAEFDLAGDHQNQYAFHWRHLYVNAEHETGWSILFGQTWHLWKMVTPSEIDGAWMENAGHPYRRSPQIRVTKKWEWEDSSLEARVGIVKGGPGMGGDRDNDSIQDNTASAWCLVEGALIYDHVAPWQNKADDLSENRWLVGIGGMYGNDRSHRMSGVGEFNGQEDEYRSAMGMLAASLPIWHFTLKGQIFGGQDLGGVQAGCGQQVSYNTFGGRGNEVRTVGGFLDLGYKLNDTWSFALGYGFDNPVDSDVERSLNGCGILYNDRAYVDAFYNITANFRLGLEYARLMTSYADCYDGGTKGGDYNADRVQFSAFYDF